MEESSESKQPFYKRLSWKQWLGIAVVVVSLSLAGYFYLQAQEAQQNTAEGVQARNLEESRRVVEKLSEILVTESERDPTVARVEDPSVLRNANPDFYKNVETGDFIVLYPQRAIIYRESENRIINVAPIINTSQLTPSASDAADIETGESEQQ